jgi:hypothetical protein
MKATIENAISGIKVGTAKSFCNLTIFPLFDGGGRKADYLTLDEALAQKCARITEVSEGGHVPELKFVNESDKSVFVLDGEELTGAKQNRVVNLSILVPAGKTLIIPVSCVEAGRWRHTSREFSTSPRAQFAEGRAKRMSQVTHSMKSRGARVSDQQQVWDDINKKAGKFGVFSRTSAMSDIYEKETVRIEDYVGAFAPADGQVGVLFAINGRIAGVDLFDSEETLRKLYLKILRSYALDALDASVSPEQEAPELSVGDAEAFLNAVKDAELKSFPAVGEGQDARLTGSGLTGAALMTEDRVVHLGAFRLN